MFQDLYQTQKSNRLNYFATNVLKSEIENAESIGSFFYEETMSDRLFY